MNPRLSWLPLFCLFSLSSYTRIPIACQLLKSCSRVSLHLHRHKLRFSCQWDWIRSYLHSLLPNVKVKVDRSVYFSKIIISTAFQRRCAAVSLRLCIVSVSQANTECMSDQTTAKIESLLFLIYPRMAVYGQKCRILKTCAAAVASVQNHNLNFLRARTSWGRRRAEHSNTFVRLLYQRRIPQFYLLKTTATEKKPIFFPEVTPEFHFCSGCGQVGRTRVPFCQWIKVTLTTVHFLLQHFHADNSVFHLLSCNSL